jgi:hypothetical protein
MLDVFLAGLDRRGVRVWADGGRVLVRPADRLTDRDRETIRAQKPALLRVLRGGGSAARAGGGRDWPAEGEDGGRHHPKGDAPAAVATTASAASIDVDVAAAVAACVHEAWEERAAIMEFDGGLGRAAAEAEASADVLCLTRGADAPVVGSSPTPSC